MEHKFLGSLLAEYWKRNWPDRIEVSRPEVDNTGYDLILEAKGVIRHVQLKSSVGKPTTVPVNRLLEGKLSGCVIYLLIDDHLEIQEFRWFGNKPGEPMNPVSVYKLESGKRHKLPLAEMQSFDSITEVIEQLFG